MIYKINSKNNIQFIFILSLLSSSFLVPVNRAYAQQVMPDGYKSDKNLATALPPIEPAPVIFEVPHFGASDPIRTSSTKQENKPIIAEKPIIDEKSSETVIASKSNNEPMVGSLPEALHAALVAKNNAAILSFYEGRGNQPLWIENNQLNSQAKLIQLTLNNAQLHGLKQTAYKTVELNSGWIEAELSITTAALQYAHDARGGRLNPRRISRLITAEPSLPQTLDVLVALSSSVDAGAVLESYNPHHEGYKALKTKLAETGNVQQKSDIIANMERWRWLPLDLGSSYILVNIPEYQLRMVRNGVQVHQTRVIVGKPNTPTPIFSGDMDHLIVNPYWNIPPSIALKEMLPQLQQDPHALERRGFEVVRRGKVVDPASIDWTSGVYNITIRQLPGERNALGAIKFMFPNDHAVYLHDTPSRGLFNSASRALSHGCVRVAEPFGLAQTVLEPENGYSSHRLRSMVGGAERTFNLKTKLPVHLGYFTSFVDENGQYQSRSDIYGYNRRVKMALGL